MRTFTATTLLLLFTSLAYAETGTLVLEEQFNASTKTMIYTQNEPDFETLFISEGTPTMTSVGWGGFYDSARTDRQFSIDPDRLGGSSQWFPATGNGILNIYDAEDAEGTYVYTPVLRLPIDLSQPGSRVQWDASGSFNADQPHTIAIRIILKTAANGWILSSDINGDLLNRSLPPSWTAPGNKPPYDSAFAGLTWTLISNAEFVPDPDLSGTDMGYADDPGALILGSAVEPDLSVVTGFGLYINSSLGIIGDLDMDAIRLTGREVDSTPNAASSWSLYR